MKNNFDFTWKYKDFEIRTTHSYGKVQRPYIELIYHYLDDNGRDYCFTLAYWHKNQSGGYDLIFVGDRPLEYIAEIDVSVIWKQLYLAQQMFEDAEARDGDSDLYC